MVPRREYRAFLAESSERREERIEPCGIQRQPRRIVMASPEDRIAEFAPRWVWHGPRCIATDYAVNFVVEQGDPALRNQLMAVQLEATAGAYRALAEGAAAAAKIVGGNVSAKKT